MYQDAMESAMQNEKSDGSWDVYADGLHESLETLEQEISDVEDLRKVCKDEWCVATECLLQEATVSAFAISEPHWASPEDSRKLKEIKKKIHDLHAGAGKV
jgi:hypothetical protein